MKKLLLIFQLLLILVSCKSISKTHKEKEVVELIQKVNIHWIDTHTKHGNAFWNRAAYHTGNIEAYKVTKDDKFLIYSLEWAKNNEWKGAKSNNKSEWKYSYGESKNYVLFGDYQICFQVYVDLYEIEPSPEKIARAIEVMEYQMSTDRNDYWWWSDGLYMVMPVMTRLYKITGNELYLEKLYEYWSYANSIMWDEEAGLYYRDAKYVYPKHKSINGKKDFWARGDGWVFAAFCRVLNDLPKENKHRTEYINHYKKMAAALKLCQQEEGYWTRSMLDPQHAPGRETSGTAFFTYAFMWGINNGVIDESEYGEVVEKGWDYLENIAVQKNGSVGYVQPIGERAIPGQVVDVKSTADFGVGAFLLAASERLRYLRK
ncbi:glycoside hydrolase family 88 protein [Wenyingzhuangia sp. chi5]|uniref:Glycoside hydrolase family 88 protein n=1 Tax=Wenyingzhuangia gilva TaxID=3057677 RepID=A0ABT8VTP2_9FLAO|nr:glycoside hydrolase family 88 protein [Wenyingzhuangia sp. chi5]MDO3695334.1 glycoside hydrolase family 88 protein [Wenyingzhuangia sp. chi5]